MVLAIQICQREAAKYFFLTEKVNILDLQGKIITCRSCYDLWQRHVFYLGNCEEGKRNSCFYNTPFGDLLISVFGEKVENNLKK